MIPAPRARILFVPLVLAGALTLGLHAARAEDGSGAAKSSAAQAKASAKSAQASSALAGASRPSAGTVAARSGINETPAEPVSVKEDIESRGAHAPQAEKDKVAAARAQGKSAGQRGGASTGAAAK